MYRVPAISSSTASCDCAHGRRLHIGEGQRALSWVSCSWLYRVSGVSSVHVGVLHGTTMFCCTRPRMHVVPARRHATMTNTRIEYKNINHTTCGIPHVEHATHRRTPSVSRKRPPALQQRCGYPCRSEYSQVLYSPSAPASFAQPVARPRRPIAELPKRGRRNRLVT